MASSQPGQRQPPTDGIGLVVLAEPPSQSRIQVDIVFVHGLRGKRISTWRADGTARCWPESFLASDIPEARILSFGYDADVALVLQPAGQNTIANHAENLLGRLANLRGNQAANRPIIFVAHSLGGLLVEDALAHARSDPEAHRAEILSMTRGIIFMGTPHCGSDHEKWAKVLTGAVRIVKPVDSGIVRVLDRDSEVLARIQTGFLTMLRTQEPAIKITCFFEEFPHRWLKSKVVETQSAVLPAYPKYSIHADHSRMTKFATSNDDGYMMVRDVIRLWMRDMSSPADDTRRHWERQNNVHQVFSGNNITNGGSVIQGTQGNITLAETNRAQEGCSQQREAKN